MAHDIQNNFKHLIENARTTVTDSPVPLFGNTYLSPNLSDDGLLFIMYTGSIGHDTDSLVVLVNEITSAVMGVVVSYEDLSVNPDYLTNLINALDATAEIIPRGVLDSGTYWVNYVIYGSVHLRLFLQSVYMFGRRWINYEIVYYGANSIFETMEAKDISINFKKFLNLCYNPNSYIRNFSKELN